MNPRQKLEYLTLEQLDYKYSILDNKNFITSYSLNKNTSFSSTHNYSSGCQKKSLLLGKDMDLL